MQTLQGEDLAALVKHLKLKWQSLNEVCGSQSWVQAQRAAARTASLIGRQRPVPAMLVHIMEHTGCEVL